MSAAPAGSRPRPARRALDELSLPVDGAIVETLAASSPDWLAADRRAAFEAWSRLPAESNLLYTPYIDLRAAALDAAMVVTDLPAGGRTGGATVPDDADGLLELTEGVVTTATLSTAAAAAGVTLTTFDELLASDPARARALVQDGPGLPADDKFAQLTRALWRLGVVVDIPAGVHLERPIVVRAAVGEAGRALLSRTFIHLGDGATATIVEELVGTDASIAQDAGQAFLAGTSEVIVGAGATLAMASLQELPAHVVAFQHRRAEVGDAATLHWALAQLGGRLVRSRVDNRLVGDRSSAEQVEIVFGGDDQAFDLTSYTTHIGRDTTGNLLSKAVLLDQARSYMKGLITIERSAIGTDSFLGEFGMNLSKAARSVAIPSLEIDQPDCRRAMHSSSVGPIDEGQLFYLESRGIPPDDARKYVVLGFLEPVVARVPLTGARERLRTSLETKWDDASPSAGAAA